MCHFRLLFHFTRCWRHFGPGYFVKMLFSHRLCPPNQRYLLLSKQNKWVSWKYRMHYSFEIARSNKTWISRFWEPICDNCTYAEKCSVTYRHEFSTGTEKRFSATFLKGVEDARSWGKLDPLLRTDVMLAAHAYAELNAQGERNKIGQCLQIQAFIPVHLQRASHKWKWSCCTTSWKSTGRCWCQRQESRRRRWGRCSRGDRWAWRFCRPWRRAPLGSTETDLTFLFRSFLIRLAYCVLGSTLC